MVGEGDVAERPSVLVVEDDPETLAAVADALAEEGYRVRRAAHGVEALGEIREQVPDLVVSDVHMPVLGEGPLLRRLRELNPPVVLVSADTNWAHTAGMAFVPKPFDLDDLLDVVARMLHRESGG